MLNRLSLCRALANDSRKFKLLERQIVLEETEHEKVTGHRFNESSDSVDEIMILSIGTSGLTRSASPGKQHFFEKCTAKSCAERCNVRPTVLGTKFQKVVLLRFEYLLVVLATGSLVNGP